MCIGNANKNILSICELFVSEIWITFFLCMPCIINNGFKVNRASAGCLICILIIYSGDVLDDCMKIITKNITTIGCMIGTYTNCIRTLVLPIVI